MTKTQLSVRIAPETLTAIDAEARRLGVSRGHVVDRWLTDAARPIEQARYKAELLADEARGAAVHGYVTAALNALADAIDVLAGTAPE